MGILSQGLRIAPPEAPVTGYMVRRNSLFVSSVASVKVLVENNYVMMLLISLTVRQRPLLCRSSKQERTILLCG